MAPKTSKKQTSTGNPEADRALAEVSRLEGVREALISHRDELVAKNASLTAELSQTKESLNKAIEEIKNLKDAMDLSKDKDRQKTDGFLEIVFVPPIPGIKPGPKYCSGILYNSSIDGNGFHHWLYPIAQAKTILGTIGANHVLAGPVDSVMVEQRRGAYAEMVEIKRHVCRQVGSEFKWIPVEIEESKEVSA